MKKLFMVLLLIFPIISSAELKIGQCINTTVTIISHRFKNDPLSGSFISFRNGTGLVAYETVPEVEHSDIDDVVRLCRLAPPPDFYKDCPKYDHKQYYMKLYSVFNYRTKEKFEGGDREHIC